MFKLDKIISKIIPSTQWEYNLNIIKRKTQY